MEIKIVVVGDHGVGKTSLLLTFSKQGDLSGVLARKGEQDWWTVYDHYTEMRNIDGLEIVLDLHDTQAQEEYSRLRPLSYPNTDVFILCVSIDDIHSILNLQKRWIPELQHHAPGTPMLLCGLKTDLRENANSDQIPTGDSWQQLQTTMDRLKYSKIEAVDCIIKHWRSYCDDRFLRVLQELIASYIDTDISSESNQYIAMNRNFGESLSAEIGAEDYVECSAVKYEGIESVFERAALLKLKPVEPPVDSRCCCHLL